MTNTNRDISFLPQGATNFFKKRAAEVVSIILIVLSLFLFISFISSSESDPSLNNLSDSAVSNWFGMPGAITADISFQIFGISIYLLIPILLSWSWKLISHKGIKTLWLKIFFLIITLVIFSLINEIILNNFNKFFIINLSGLIGELIYKYSISLISPNINFVYLINILLFIIGFLSFIYSLSLSSNEWKKIGKFFQLLLKKIFNIVLWFSRTGEKLALKPKEKKDTSEVSNLKVSITSFCSFFKNQ